MEKLMFKFSYTTFAKICIFPLISVNTFCELNAEENNNLVDNVITSSEISQYHQLDNELTSTAKLKSKGKPSMVPPKVNSGLQGSISFPLPAPNGIPTAPSSVEFTQLTEGVWNIHHALLIQLIGIQEAILNNEATQNQFAKLLHSIDYNANTTFKNLLKQQNVKNAFQLANYLGLQARFPISYYLSLVSANCDINNTPGRILEKWESFDDNYVLLLKQSLPAISYRKLYNQFSRLRTAYVNILNDLHYNKLSFSSLDFAKINKIQQAIANEIALASLK